MKNHQTSSTLYYVVAARRYNFKVDIVTLNKPFLLKHLGIQSHVPSLFPGCQGGRGRGGNDEGSDGGVYRYDYDDLDIRPTSSSTTPGGIGRNRFVRLFKSWVYF